MTFNPALTYAEFLSMSCLNCQMNLQYILDSVSEFNGYYMVRRCHKGVYVYCLVILHLVDLLPNSETQGHFQT